MRLGGQLDPYHFWWNTYLFLDDRPLHLFYVPVRRPFDSIVRNNASFDDVMYLENWTTQEICCKMLRLFFAKQLQYVELMCECICLRLFKHTWLPNDREADNTALYALRRVCVSSNKSQQRAGEHRHNGHFKRQESFQLSLKSDYIGYMAIQYIFRTCFSVVEFEDRDFIFGAYIENVITGVAK